MGPKHHTNNTACLHENLALCFDILPLIRPTYPFSTDEDRLVHLRTLVHIMKLCLLCLKKELRRT